MKRKISSLLLVAVAFLGGYGYARRFASTAPLASAANTHRILYYRCPMHPANRSDAPGTTPCCHMPFEPVYADAYAGTSESDSVPVGAIHVTAQQQQVMGLEYASVEYTPASRPTQAVARIAFNQTRVARVQSKLDGFVDRLNVSAVGEQLLTIYNRRTYVMPQMQFLQSAMDASGMGQLPPGVDPTQKRLADAEALRLARLNLEMLGFTDDQIEAVARAHQSLTSLPIFAPISGVIVEFNAALHQKLTMDPLITIADLSSVWATADFFQSDAAGIVSGQLATLTVPYLPGKRFQGKVDTLLPVLDANTHAVRVRLVFENPGQLLRPEMSGDIEVSPPPGRKRLTVPRDAVLNGGRSETVFVALGNGYIRPQHVRTGQQWGDRLEILAGLKPGERIVTSGNFLLEGEAALRSTR